MPKRKRLPPEDWEHFVWFVAAHKLNVYEAHIRGIDELESSVGAFDEELYAHIRDYIDIYKIKNSPPKKGADKKLTEREYLRVFDNLKEYIRRM